MSTVPPKSFVDTLPSWAAELVRALQAKQANTFLIHGTVADLVPVRSSSGLRFLSLESFLQQELFTGWPALITYNRAEGLGFSSPEARGHFQDKMKSYDAVHGTSYAQALPRDPGNAFALLDSYFRSCAMAQPARPVVMMLPFADTVVPAGDASYRTPEDRVVLVYLRKWSQDPTLLAKNIVVVLVTETLAEIDPKLLRANAAREVEIVRPDQRGRHVPTGCDESPQPAIAPATTGMRRFDDTSRSLRIGAAGLRSECPGRHPGSRGRAHRNRPGRAVPPDSAELADAVEHHAHLRSGGFDRAAGL